jgi:hypothetical protein
MVVKCINDTYTDNPSLVLCQKGNYYHVVQIHEKSFEGKENDTYYEFLETGKMSIHHYSCFMPVNENEYLKEEIEKHENKERNTQSI